MSINYSTDCGLRTEQVRADDIKQIDDLPGATLSAGNGDELLRALSTVTPGGKIRLKAGVYADKDFESKVPSVQIYSDLNESPIQGAPLAVFKNSRIKLSGEGSGLARVMFDDSGSITKSNLLQVRGANNSLLGITFSNLRPINNTSPLLVVFEGAHNVLVRDSDFRNSSGFVVTLRESDTGEVARDANVVHNLFVDCPDYFFQAGQYGLANKEACASFGQFAYNKVINCRSAQVKVSEFTTIRNMFVNVKQGFNLRHGNYNTLKDNLFKGGDYAGRIFGGHHTVQGNIVLNPLVYSFGLPEGSLQSQFRALANANHVAAHHVEFTDNYIVSGLQSAFHIGQQQTGKLGGGYSRDPNSPDYPHYEPYSPTYISIRRNVIVVGQGVPLHLRKPDTVPNKYDGYPANASSIYYEGVNSSDNTVLLSNGCKEDPEAHKYAHIYDRLVVV